MNYSIGLDIGIASIGSAVMLLNDECEPYRIWRMRSRVFEKAENPKDGSSLALPRREFRGSRRRLRRRKLRKETIKFLISENLDITIDEIEDICVSSSEKEDIYIIRAEALDRKISKTEFVRLLIHLSQRRGFKSNRKSDSQDKNSEAGKLLNAVKSNTELLEEKGYRTIGEMLYKDPKFSQYKRNKGENYTNTFSRQQYEQEIKYIFKKQREFENIYAKEDLENKYLKIYLGQRSFDMGPGGDSPYGGNMIEKMLGKCTFEKDELRAVKASYSFEYFNLLSKVNAIKLVTADGKKPLSKEQRDTLIKLAFDKKSITYSSIRKALSLSEDVLFNISYSSDNFEETEKKTDFSYLKAYHTFKKYYDGAFAQWDVQKKNSLAYALTVFKNDEKITECLKSNGFDEAEVAIALTLPSFSKTANLSVKALDKINPYLEKGMLYNEACEAAGYDFRNSETDKRLYLPANPEQAKELCEIKNPVVRRAVSQTIKVINAIIREMGESPQFVKIELARELSKNFTDRKKIEKQQNENRVANERIMDELRSTFGLINPTGQDLIKLRLWKEQDGKCPYSNESIEAERLFDIGYTDIDHIIPYSLTFDDSYNNKILVKSKENRQKGNRLPLEYLTGKRKDEFCIWVQNSNLNYRKKKNLLKEKLTEEEINNFKKRNLNDTQYISRFLLNYIKKYLLMSPNSKGIKNTVISVNGAATAYMRKRWGISKIRENGDVHHAVDAVVIACMTQGMIKRISEYSKYHETEFYNEKTDTYFDVDRKTGEVINRFPLPYKEFRRELTMLCSNNPSMILHSSPLVNYSTDEAIEPIFVSRMANYKVTGAAHKETVRKQISENGISYNISKVPLERLALKNGEIENYYNPESDTLLYNAFKKRLADYGGKGKNAFAEPFYKPKSDGTRGPLVKKVKIKEKSTLAVSLHNGTASADNGSMIRTDVFFVEGKGYFLVPIYVSDTVREKLPNKAIAANKSYEHWTEVNDEDFIFSVYPNDLIKVKSKKEMVFSLVNKNSTLGKTYKTKEEFVYFKSSSISTASITIINHDNTYTIPSLGVKRLELLEKYNVDVLGNITKVGKEKRRGFK